MAVKAPEGAFGLRPQDLHSIYQLPTAAASTQTIALVDAYNDLSAEADLKVYDKEFGLPECTAANKCFEQLNQNGETGNPPFPQSKVSREAEEVICKTAIGKTKEAACKEVEEASGWSEEISLDIETAHAVCQNCKIMLVEANAATFPNLEAAEETAVRLTATEISDSWGGPGQGVTAAEDDASAFKHPGIVITAASGDNGYLDWAAEEPSERGFADYPASSPHVVAVGGTRLLQNHGAWEGETMWNDGGQNTEGEIEGAALVGAAAALGTRRSVLAANRLRLGIGRLWRTSRRCGYLGRRRPLYGRRDLRLHRRMRIREGGNAQGLVHDRRHEPGLAARRLGVRARRWGTRSGIPRADPVRKSGRVTQLVARCRHRVQRGMLETL